MTRTKSEQARFDNMKDLGCIACILDGRLEPFPIHPTYPDIHHMDGRVKPGCELKTVPLCKWHHDGVANGIPNKVMLENIGPSWHKHRPYFRRKYGSDKEVIEAVNKYLEPSE